MEPRTLATPLRSVSGSALWPPQPAGGVTDRGAQFPQSGGPKDETEVPAELGCGGLCAGPAQAPGPCCPRPKFPGLPTHRPDPASSSRSLCVRVQTPPPIWAPVTWEWEPAPGQRDLTLTDCVSEAPTCGTGAQNLNGWTPARDGDRSCELALVTGAERLGPL